MNRRRLTAAGVLVTLTTAAALISPTTPATAGPWDGVRSWETATVQRVVDGDIFIEGGGDFGLGCLIEGGEGNALRLGHIGDNKETARHYKRKPCSYPKLVFQI